mmetsp:Transcript_4026/g.7621  ORF Transcript_4026/g.7621 Transcript_4026/m.7621 type:complete len:552 (+) Transcript_4026:279-1934(+)
MSDSEDEYDYEYSDDDEVDEGEEMTSTTKAPQEGSDSDNDDDKKPPANSSLKTPSSKEGNANPNAPPTGGSLTAAYDNGSSPLPANKSGVRLLAAADLAAELDEVLAEVSEMLSVPPEAAGALMRVVKFNKERLLDGFMSDDDKLLSKAGVFKRVRCPKAPPLAPPGPSPGRSTRSCEAKNKADCSCGICCDDDFEPSEMYSMACGHSFCRDCWGGFVGSKLTDGPSCVYARCPEAGCDEVVTNVDVRDVGGDEKEWRKWELRSFVDLNKNMRWCPGADCDKVAVSKTGEGEANCECGRDFCLKCGEEPHSPVSCKDFEKWLEKCQNESETANWILANTKKCPKCYTRIEKNQGCNHITCQQCKYDFCWICGEPWEDHGANTGGYYKCNKFKSNEKDSNDQSDAAKAKRELDRYLHYYQRYHAHAQAQKFAKKQLLQTEARMVSLQEGSADTSWIDVQFLKEATEQLVECRRVLKQTYVYAYYLPLGAPGDEGRKDRFEHHQEMLERFTESLSELSEQSLEKMDRADVVNMTRVVNNFVKNIVKYVEEGED